MGIKIRVSGIPANWKSRYTIYREQENKQETNKLYGRETNSKRDTQNRPEDTQKRSVRDSRIYTGKVFLETSPKMKVAFKPNVDLG